MKSFYRRTIRQLRFGVGTLTIRILIDLDSGRWQRPPFGFDYFWPSLKYTSRLRLNFVFVVLPGETELFEAAMQHERIDSRWLKAGTYTVETTSGGLDIMSD
jgi:hypothetical protein